MAQIVQPDLREFRSVAKASKKHPERCATHQEDPHDLIDDSESIVHMELVDREPVGGKSKSVYDRYRYPLQEFKLDSGACFAPHLKQEVGEIVRVEEGDDWGTITLVRAPRHLAREIVDAIVVRSIVPATSIRAALARLSESLLEGECRHRFSAAFDILTNGAPRLKSGPRLTLQPEIPEETSIQPLLNDLDDSYLFIQGPPGSGKTYTGARLIANLLQKGLRIGISANSHKAIHNLLAEIESVAHKRNSPFFGIKKMSKDNSESEFRSAYGYIANADSFESDEAQLFAGTAWAICPAFVNEPLDYLFIDEAGQVALPHAVAMSTTAKNVVLLGDPLQLPQVAHTSHPGGIGNSVLEHLIGDELRPVASDRGILLTQSYRMNEPICRFVSDMIYEGRLTPAPGRELQRVSSPGISGRGLRFIAVEHENNRQRSGEEALAIAEQAVLLLQGMVTDYAGTTRSLLPNDIIVVTPYNAQVRCIKKALYTRGGGCASIEVGTVDRFQGREAHVVFFSTAASTIEDAPRGISFLFDRNRLNVAISRARSVAIFVGSPALLTAPCSTVENARSMNAILSFVEHCGRDEDD